MSEMVERVAKAIWDVEDTEDKLGDWDDGKAVPENWKDECRTKAREAIKTMREPTKEMIAKGSWRCYITLPGPNGNDGIEPSPNRCWQTMITEALK